MSEFLGFDTSNYTTSAAVAEGGAIISNGRIMLAVAEGGRGLRQSDAVFAHTVNLPKLTAVIGRRRPAAVGCSAKPRDVDGSYMPCFLPGVAAASACADLLGVPLYRFSHQAGHITAALFGCGRLDLWSGGGEFLAYHASGGTTELLHVKNRVITRLGGTLDISAGKAVDRIGLKLGLRFPCGAELEKLAAGADLPGEPVKICVRDCDFNLSGLENKADELLSGGAPAAAVAVYTQEVIARTLAGAAESAARRFPGLPLICAGGVMSNRYIAAAITAALRGRFDAYFAPPELSCDNAAGIALLTELEYDGGNDYGS